MKIEGNRQNPEPAASLRVNAPRSDRSGEAEKRQKAAGDRVKVSDEAALVRKAIRAAAEAPDIRHDAVDRAKKRVEATRSDRSGDVEKRQRAAADRVKVSDEAAFVRKAIRAATEAPDIRHDAVDRAKKRVAAGEVGADSARLADRVIHSLRRGIDWLD